MRGKENTWQSEGKKYEGNWSEDRIDEEIRNTKEEKYLKPPKE
jgi:hypothetical protein